MVVVTICEGKIRGRISEDIQANKFFVFQGIPYGDPPIGNLRFKAPRPVQPWSGIKDATEEGNESISRHLITRETVGSEDCLNLNVYTPDLPDHDKVKILKPVMFWIHGGIFSTGSNKTELFGPEFLMPEDIVLVTINYRLGILGFLSLDDTELGVPGNAGFKDMVLALKWVKRNINNFCGDPNNVTVFGQSAGGVAAHLLMLSPMARNLMHKVILQSGSALNEWTFGRRCARLIARELGFFSSDDRKLLPFLQSVPPEDIMNAQNHLDAQDFVENDIRLFGVVVERSSCEEPFLTQHPRDIIFSGNYTHIPMIMGYNLGEGATFDAIAPPRSREIFFSNMELSVPLSLKIERGSQLSQSIGKRLENFYYKGGRKTKKENLAQYYTLGTDMAFLRDIYLSAKFHLQTSKKPIYFYRLSLKSNLNIFKKLSGSTHPYLYHSDDLGYLFKTNFTPLIKPGSIEDVAQRRFTRLWTNFARFGNPTPVTNDSLLNITWKPIEYQNFRFLDIGEKLTLQNNPEPERMSLWEDIYRDVSTFKSKL